MHLLDTGRGFLSHFSLTSGDRLTRARKSHLTKPLCSKTLGIHHFGQCGACSRLSYFCLLIEAIEATMLFVITQVLTKERNNDIRIALDSTEINLILVEFN